MDTGNQIAAHTEDLTAFGCYIETATPFANGANVALLISHNGATVAAKGKVAHSKNAKGMGIRFTSIEKDSVPIIDAWLAELGGQ